ncbi:MAG: glycoside hydrolase family 16 protein [Chitinophagaceae bacterium]
MSGSFDPSAIYAEGFNYTAGPASAISAITNVWSLYDSVGNAGNGFRKPAQITIANEATAPSGDGKVLRITSQNVSGQHWSGGMQLNIPMSYGQVELRVRVSGDSTAGTPTGVTSGVVLFWPQSNIWPNGGEIDWWESYDHRDTRVPAETNIHWNPSNPSVDLLAVQHLHTGISQIQWHKVVGSWTPDRVWMNIDDGPDVLITDDPLNIPNQAMQLAIQLDAWSSTPPTSPVTMDVDYIILRSWVPPTGISGVEDSNRGQYEVLVTNLLSGEIISTVEMNDMYWEKIYQGPGSFYGTVRFDNPTSTATNFRDYTNGIWVVKDGVIKWGGIQGRVQRRGETRSISVPAIGFLDYLNERILRNAQGMTYGTIQRVTDIEWNNIDVFRIYKDCVDHLQSFEDGNLHLGVVWDALSGYTTRLIYPTFAAKRIGPLLLQLANRGDTGFDILQTYRWENGQPRCDIKLIAPQLNNVSDQMLLFQLDRLQVANVSAGNAVSLPGNAGGRLTSSTQYTDQSLSSLATPYTDPVTNNPVYRLTTDGANNSLSNILGDSTGYDPWSRTSTKFLYTQYSPTDSTRRGIYIYDIVAGASYPVCTTDSPYSFPIFSHDEDKIYFLKGMLGTNTGAGSKPIKLYSAPVPNTPDYGAIASIDTSTLELDIVALAEASSFVLSDVRCLSKNVASQSQSRYIGFQAKTASGWMSLVKNAVGGFVTGWAFTSPNSHHTATDMTMLWSDHSSDLLYACRATSTSNHTVIRSVWNVAAVTAAYSPATTGGAVLVEDSAWAYHLRSDTELHVGKNSNPWSRTAGTGTINSAKGTTFSALHMDLDKASVGFDLKDVRVAATEYDSTSGAINLVYLFPIGDFNVGNADSEITDWTTIRANRRLCGHRGTNTFTGNLLRFTPYPFISPNGKYIIFNSDSQTSIGGFTYPSPAGSNNGTVAYTDLYLVKARQSTSTIRDVEIVFEATAPDWTPSANQCIASVWGSSGNRGWRAFLLTNGKIRFEWSTDGTATVSADSTNAVTFTNGQAGTIKIVFDVNNGSSNFVARFWQSTDGGVTWTTL